MRLFPMDRAANQHHTRCKSCRNLAVEVTAVYTVERKWQFRVLSRKDSLRKE
jgi:hypothetical protein